MWKSLQSPVLQRRHETFLCLFLLAACGLSSGLLWVQVWNLKDSGSSNHDVFVEVKQSVRLLTVTSFSLFTLFFVNKCIFLHIWLWCGSFWIRCVKFILFQLLCYLVIQSETAAVCNTLLSRYRLNRAHKSS